MNYNFYPSHHGRQILKVGDFVYSHGEIGEVAFIHEDGLINLKMPDGFFKHGVHPNTVEKIEWQANYVECSLCTHKWAAVYPANIIDLECPNCRNTSQIIIHSD